MCASASALAIAGAGIAAILAAVGTAAADPIPLFAEDFEDGAPGWTGTGLWHLSTARASSPSHSFHYGGILGANGTSYDNGAANAGDLVSPVIDLTNVSRAKVAFWSWWDAEGCPWEHPILAVELANGTRAVVREWCAPGGEDRLEANLTAFVGGPVRLVYSWSTIDAIQNGYEGWYVDDVVVTEADAAPASRPDLVVTHANVTGPRVAGQASTLNALVKNAGNTSTPSGFAVEFRIDGDVVARRIFPPGFAVGSVAPVSVNVTMPASGLHALEVVADADGNVTETNESNNVATVAFEVADPRLNLAIRNASLPAEIYAGRTIPLRFNVTNEGNQALPVNVTFAIEVGNHTQSGLLHAGLGPGAVHGVLLQFPAPAVGPHVLTIRVDVHENATETTREDNVLLVPFEVIPTAEIGVDILSLDPVPRFTPAGPVPDPFGGYVAQIDVCNAGAGPGKSGILELRLESRGTVGTSAGLPPRVIPPLAPSACVDLVVRFNATATIGDFQLRATALVSNDGASWDNSDTAEGARLVGGAGGVVLAAPIGVPLAGNVGWALLNVTESSLCVASSFVFSNELCNNTLAGNPGLGVELRPCTRQPPANGPGAHWPAYVLWYGVTTVDGRSTLRPEPLFKSGDIQVPPQSVLDLFPEVGFGDLVPSDKRLCEPLYDRFDEFGEAMPVIP